MNIEIFRDHCLSKPGTSESFPFDETTLVFKVMGKMFALCGLEPFEDINLKCDPEKALQLREQHEGVKPGYHMNKKHWNTVDANLIADGSILSWTDNSYDLVVNSLPKKLKDELASL